MIGRLPPELLRFVLKYGTGTEARDVLAYSHVAHLWRSISLSMPSLWAVLDSRLGSSCASIFLARSRRESLDIRVVQRGLCLEDDYDFKLNKFFLETLHHVNRWSRFTVDASLTQVVELATNHIAEFLFSPIGQNIPTLDSVIFSVNHYIAHDQVLEPEHYRELRVAPFCMRSLTLNAVPCRESGYYTPELRYLHLCNIEGRRSSDVLDFRGLVRVLTQAPNLEELVFENSGPRLEEGDAEPMAAVKLTALYIRGLASAAGLIRLFSQLDVPVLRYLHLDIWGALSEMLEVLSMLPKTLPLVDLRIKRRHRVLQVAKRRRKNVPEELRPLPTWTESVGFPHLEVLCLDELCCENTVKPEILSTFLRRRLDDANSSAIKYLRVEWCHHISTSSIIALQDLVPIVESREAAEDNEDSDYEPDSDEDNTEYSDSEPDACIQDTEEPDMHTISKQLLPKYY